MWVLKASIWHEDSFGINQAVKNNIHIWAYPIAVYKKHEKIFVTAWHLVFGEEEGKKNYFSAAQKNSRLKEVEVDGDVIIYSFATHAEKSHWKYYTLPGIIFLKPTIFKPDGFEYAEFGAWKKEILEKFVNEGRKHMKINVQSISKQKTGEVFVPHLMPKLTEKQKQALNLAYTYGYYNKPRKITLEELAKKLGVSYTTFQEHIRKAEEKIIPYFLEITQRTNK